MKCFYKIENKYICQILEYIRRFKDSVHPSVQKKIKIFFLTDSYVIFYLVSISEIKSINFLVLIEILQYLQHLFKVQNEFVYTSIE